MSKKYWLLIIITPLFLEGCMDLESFPNEPQIAFKTFSVSADGSGAKLIFSFTDGDGNFGLNQEDTSGVFADCQTRYNVFCDYYEKQNGTWTKVSLDPCLDPNIIPFYYRAPVAVPEGQYKAQKGTVTLDIQPVYYLPSSFDTCKFKVHVIDRSLNQSNEIETGEFYKP
jgi:hypothetical protein